jgi:hypothetical protein
MDFDLPRNQTDSKFSTSLSRGQDNPPSAFDTLSIRRFPSAEFEISGVDSRPKATRLMPWYSVCIWDCGMYKADEASLKQCG